MDYVKGQTMKHGIAITAAALLLSGCVTTREVVYREPYPGNAPPLSHSGTIDSHGSYRLHDQGGGTYYAPARSGMGDYYVGTAWSSGYLDAPFYYSVFWPLNRYYYDPFHYPDYYYGVTWYPRNYFSFGLGWRHGWSSFGLSYSPYRYAWVDDYYDWQPWYWRYPRYRHYYPAPRHGDARIEARRLAGFRPPAAPPHTASWNDDGLRTASPRPSAPPRAPAYSGNRAADYGRHFPGDDRNRAWPGQNPTARLPRTPPATGAFGNPTHLPSPAPGQTREQLHMLRRSSMQPLQADPLRQRMRARDEGSPVHPRVHTRTPPGALESQSPQLRGYSISPSIRREPIRTPPPALHELRGGGRLHAPAPRQAPPHLETRGGLMPSPRPAAPPPGRLTPPRPHGFNTPASVAPRNSALPPPSRSSSSSSSELHRIGTLRER